MKSFLTLGLILTATVLVNCSSKSEDDTETTTTGTIINADKPSDSTGVTASVDLSFAATDALSLNLQEAAESLEIDENIILNYAKFSIAKIRIKANREVSANEEKLAKEEALEEVAAVESFEQEVGLSDLEPTSLSKDAMIGERDARSQLERKEERIAKVKEKHTSLKADEDASLVKESKKDGSTKFVGPYVFNAITGKIEGDAPSTDVLDGSYRRIDFQLKRNFSATEEDPLLGNVFAIQGTVMKEGVAIPFEIEWHVALNFRLNGDSAFSITAGEDNALVIDFKPTSWFEGIDLAAATIDADGTIYINKSSNKDLMKQLHKNIKMNAGFGKDKDKDGRVSKEERSGKGEETTDATTAATEA